MTLGHLLVIAGVILGMMALPILFVTMMHRRWMRDKQRDHDYWLKQPP